MPELPIVSQFEAAYEKHKDMVYRIAKLRMHQVSDVEDVFQDVFMRLTDHISELHGDEHIKAWLIRVTINCCNSYYRSGWFRHTISLQENLSEADDDDEINVSERAEREWLSDGDISAQQSVYEAVRVLPDRDKEVIHLFYYEELSIRKISRILQQTEGAVKTRLSRARKKLESKLKTL